MRFARGTFLLMKPTCLEFPPNRHSLDFCIFWQRGTRYFYPPRQLFGERIYGG